MPRIQPTGYKTQLDIFISYGCKYKRKRGSHHVLTFPGANRAVVIPEYDEIDVDIIKNNMRTVGMTREKYFEILKKERS
ncbi:MAG: type II toxin-antitoxin system HicA family toxin [Desulfobacterales bacterium]|nr:type II toxin-antitoxin system HicA family toxin [Desulfobacterales bacterium]